MMNIPFVKVAAATPNVKIADVKYNTQETIRLCKEASENKSKLIVFPELNITGYTCGDLFYQRGILEEVEKAIITITEYTKTLDETMTIVVGAPILKDNLLYNCAVVIACGTILGIIPKTHIPNYNEFYEKRWFAPASKRESDYILLNGSKVHFNQNLLIKDETIGMCLGFDICEDLWVNIPPSSYHTMMGANIICNLSASNETIGKTDYRRMLVKSQSARCITGYIYASCGESESTTDVVFSGHSMICDNGTIESESVFGENKEIIYGEIDLNAINQDRLKFDSNKDSSIHKDYVVISFEGNYSQKSYEDYLQDSNKTIDARPFVPSNKKDRYSRCLEILNIQAAGLATRLKKINCAKVVIGISGGLDSTLALLVAVESFKKNNYPLENIIGVTMPGFGTTSRTYDNAVDLMSELGITIKTISIKESCIQHYKDIGHDINIHDITYENGQARERTQILMDLANKHNAIVVGTGDLSELALGWCTYNGDQMSMYGVNASIPKTLVKYMVETYAEFTNNKKIQDILTDICCTPVSPELLPPTEDGEIAQITEDNIGSYELHDFFIYQVLRRGATPREVYFKAVHAFKGEYSNKDIILTLEKFYKRFITQQFKRSCMPDGVKVGSICLSPRGDLRMPSDASYGYFLSEIEDLKGNVL